MDWREQSRFDQERSLVAIFITNFCRGVIGPKIKCKGAFVTFPGGVIAGFLEVRKALREISGQLYDRVCIHRGNGNKLVMTEDRESGG